MLDRPILNAGNVDCRISDTLFNTILLVEVNVGPTDRKSVV